MSRSASGDAIRPGFSAKPLTRGLRLALIGNARVVRSLRRWNVAEGFEEAVVDQPLRSLLLPFTVGRPQSAQRLNGFRAT
jgi:hypothetical protein